MKIFRSSHHFLVLLSILVVITSSTIWSTNGQVADSGGIFGNVVEGYMKDLFTRELGTAGRQNLTDCMTRLLCENICARTVKGEVKGDPLLNSAAMMGRSEADQVGYFFTGGDRGYEYGRANECHRCAERYANCHQGRYDQAKSNSGAYERSMLQGAETSLAGDFTDFRLFD
ncbi:hypothetical protein TYRP_007579 [Tyrophagus putrescentiae]|nr:hypothetical protein TYRP_007579 [Tyrophagus putrescentiae]